MPMTRQTINPQTGRVYSGNDDVWDGARTAISADGARAAAAFARLGAAEHVDGRAVGVMPTAPRLYAAVQQHIASAEMVARVTPDRVHRIVSDQMIPRESKRPLAKEAVALAREQVSNHLGNAEAHMKLLEGWMGQAALPPAPAPEREASLRADLALRLADVRAQEVPAKLAEIAQGPDRQLAGLVAQTGVAEAHLSRLDRRIAAEGREYIRLSAMAGSMDHGEGLAKVAAVERHEGLVAAKTEATGRRVLIEQALAQAEAAVPAQ